MKDLTTHADDTGSIGVPFTLVAVLVVLWYLNRKERSR